MTRATTLADTIALRPRTGDCAALSDDFGAGLGVYGRGGSDTDLCATCELDPSNATSAPFPVRRWPDAFTPAEHQALLDWLSQRSPWRVADGGFYRADVYGLTDDADVPQALKPKLGRAGHAWAEQLAADAFGARPALHGPIALHRMCPDQGVGVHSDMPLPGEETHRIVVTICAALPRRAGGHFVLLDGVRPSNARVVIPLQSNAALAFRLETHSYHAITTVREGTRFSVVMSFRLA